jgi:hypothetical protein
VLFDQLGEGRDVGLPIALAVFAIVVVASSPCCGAPARRSGQ